MERKQIRLDDQAERDLMTIQGHYSLSSRSAAIRFALREVARLIEDGRVNRGTTKDSNADSGA